MEPKIETVHDLGERALIRRLAHRLRPGRDVVVPIGDDAAVVRTADARFDWVLTTDPVVEGIHFTAETDPERIGHKAVGRVLSDLAAMGAEPLWLLIDLVVPAQTPVDRIDRIYAGADALASRHAAAIIGGDVSRGDPLQLHVFGVGRVPCGTALTRAGAQPGERLYVTGELGGSLCRRHLAFEPRVTEGMWLRDGGWVGAALDVSDGLAADLFRMLEAGTLGARIRLTSIPVSNDAKTLADGRSPLEHALEDGEDFELLFTVSADRSMEFEKAWADRFQLRCTCIGEMTDVAGKAEGMDAQGNLCPLKEGGFEHFRTSSGNVAP